jgi:hypothetical protein
MISIEAERGTLTLTLPSMMQGHPMIRHWRAVHAPADGHHHGVLCLAAVETKLLELGNDGPARSKALHTLRQRERALGSEISGLQIASAFSRMAREWLAFRPRRCHAPKTRRSRR